MEISITLCLSILLCVTETSVGTSSVLRPFTMYEHSVELQANTSHLWWTVNNVEQYITFELHVKTTGWIALGISPAGGMKGADIAVGWVDSTGQAHIQDRFAFDKITPIIDNTTQDWFVLQGQESDGWTGIQFKRYFDSCDPMDVPIRSGTNILIFAYGLADLTLSDSKVDITYHDARRGTRLLPLRSYNDPPAVEMYAGYDFFDLRLENRLIPSKDTTYYCKVFKSPSTFTEKRHAIAHEVLIDSKRESLVHHLDLFECGARDAFDDTQLPEGVCDDIFTRIRMCSSNIATSWSIGGDLITKYPEETGYAVTSDKGNKYFMIKIHYDNPKFISNHRDSSGIRFYLGNKLRQYDLGHLVFGTLSTPAALAIPPKSEQFLVDCYCPPEATRNFPSSGITIISALPHTHLQGYSVWTKLIRNNTAVEYLFNAEAFDFNYQFENRLPKPIKVYPGDAFATRCVYNTMNKNDITLGGQRTADEMCSHTFSYYPVVNSLSACLTAIDQTAWQTKMNTSSPIDNNIIQEWVLNLTWTSDSRAQWQEFYNKAQRLVMYNHKDQLEFIVLASNTTYEDLKDESCHKKEIQSSTNPGYNKSNNLMNNQHTLFLFFFILFSVSANVFV